MKFSLSFRMKRVFLRRRTGRTNGGDRLGMAGGGKYTRAARETGLDQEKSESGGGRGRTGVT
ncbi:hypothetical protein [Geoalkalibacter halelectricus]|uniref:Uncharacterized protein n=1 Tax=Geoalkalibacter halelectricus TaxID=2847045 RepID=A0ABY5ZKF4_9BACT|nr:hypothetical protein [Geoalkalibacter halelectricus]MDO3377307.1 hypothetical protein [Geoalkalibacter halelectricus]UWZ78944.1 hypothetical protein L9S41_14820 [Geoalkalibacter halelectricus]